MHSRANTARAARARSHTLWMSPFSANSITMYKFSFSTNAAQYLGVACKGDTGGHVQRATAAGHGPPQTHSPNNVRVRYARKNANLVNSIFALPCAQLADVHFLHSVPAAETAQHHQRSHVGLPACTHKKPSSSLLHLYTEPKLPLPSSWITLKSFIDMVAG